MPMMSKVDGGATADLDPDEQLKSYSKLVTRIAGPAVVVTLPAGANAGQFLSLGFCGVIRPLVGLTASINAVLESLREDLAAARDPAPPAPPPAPLRSSREILELLGVHRYLEIEREYET